MLNLNFYLMCDSCLLDIRFNGSFFPNWDLLHENFCL
jgi:hypothetical protein